MNKLLEKAKGTYFEHKGNTPHIEVTKEEVELCLAYLNREISVRQYAFAVGVMGPGNVTHRVPTVLRWGIEKNLIKILPVKPKTK